MAKEIGRDNYNRLMGISISVSRKMTKNGLGTYFSSKYLR